MSEEKVCLRCGGAMEAGFIPLGLLALERTLWIPGEENPKSFWTSAPPRFAERRKVVTYCCASCGFLESYAPKPNAAT